MDILFVSDYVCPFCIVAREALKRAAEELQISPSVTYHPFELTVPPAPQIDTYHDEKRKSHYKILEKPCRQMGLDAKFPPRVVPRPYTEKAFEGYYYALEHGRGDAYNGEVYAAYFIREEDIGSMDVLVSIARKIGLDGEDFARCLQEGRYHETLAEANRHAREDLHVNHVPTIYIGGEECEIQDYTPEEFVRILRKFM